MELLKATTFSVVETEFEYSGESSPISLAEDMGEVWTRFTLRC